MICEKKFEQKLLTLKYQKRILILKKKLLTGYSSFKNKTTCIIKHASPLNEDVPPNLVIVIVNPTYPPGLFATKTLPTTVKGM